MQLLSYCRREDGGKLQLVMQTRWYFYDPLPKGVCFAKFRHKPAGSSSVSFFFTGKVSVVSCTYRDSRCPSLYTTKDARRLSSRNGNGASIGSRVRSIRSDIQQIQNEATRTSQPIPTYIRR